MSLERDCEQALIEVLSADPQIANMLPRPRDENKSRKLPQIKVSVTRGEDQLEGPKVSELTGAIELRTNYKDTAAENQERLWTLIEDAMQVPRGLTPQTASLFGYLQFNSEARSERTSEENSRTRVREYPIFARKPIA